MNTLKYPKKLTIDIPEEIHKKIKIRAVQRNIPLRKWVLQALIIRINGEEQYD